MLGRERRDNSQLANKQGVMYISLGNLILTKKLILASSSSKQYTFTSNHNKNGKWETGEKTDHKGVSEVSRKNKKGGVIIPDDNIT